MSPPNGGGGRERGQRDTTPDPLARGEYVLTGSEAHHLATVRRLSPGDRVVLFNGDGCDYTVEIVSVNRKQTTVNVLAAEMVNRELPFRLEIAAAMPKGDRGDFLIEKLTERVHLGPVFGRRVGDDLRRGESITLPCEAALDEPAQDARQLGTELLE